MAARLITFDRDHCVVCFVWVAHSLSTPIALQASFFEIIAPRAKLDFGQIVTLGKRLKYN